MPQVIRISDPVSCGDVAATGSVNVFINGLPVCRAGVDITAGHCLTPTLLLGGSPTVFVNGAPMSAVTDPIAPHCCPGAGCHGGMLVGGSANVFVNG